MKEYTSLTCYASSPTLEVLTAVAGMLPITGVQENDNSITLFFDEGIYQESFKETLSSWANSNDVEYVLEKVMERNWNSEFEQSLEPVRVAENLIITQTWNPAAHKADDYVIFIDPKMSFGTGHHESTRLIARLMLELDFTNMNVLDIGTGTGVLAILAALKNAKKITAFDNNEWAYENTLENIALNKTENKIIENKIEVLLCELDSIVLSSQSNPQENKYDIVLMNIHRNLIMEMFNDVTKIIKSTQTAQILTSGVLYEDYQSLLDCAKKYNLVPKSEQRENEWIATNFVFEV